MSNNEVKNEQVEEVASTTTNEHVVESVKTDNTTQKSVEKNAKKSDNKKNDKKPKKAKDNGPSKISKTMSELKKVTWPTFGSVVKQTSVVLVVTIVFLVVIFGIDRLCSWLMGLIC